MIIAFSVKVTQVCETFRVYLDLYRKSNSIQIFIKKYKILKKFLKLEVIFFKNQDISSKSGEREIKLKSWGLQLETEDLERMHPGPLRTCVNFSHTDAR